MLISGSDRTGRSDPSWSAQGPPQVATNQVATSLSLPQQGGVPAPRPARGVMNSARPNADPVILATPAAIGGLRSQERHKVMSRTSDNPLRPRLASSPSPLPRGTFGYRQNNKQLSTQGLTQTPLAPAGEETDGDLASTRALTRASPERAPSGAKRAARSWEALVPTCRIRATCAVGSGKEHRREAIQIRGAAPTATRPKRDPRPPTTSGSEQLDRSLLRSKPIQLSPRSDDR